MPPVVQWCFRERDITPLAAYRLCLRVWVHMRNYHQITRRPPISAAARTVLDSEDHRHLPRIRKSMQRRTSAQVSPVGSNPVNGRAAAMSFAELMTDPHFLFVIVSTIFSLTVFFYYLLQLVKGLRKSILESNAKGAANQKPNAAVSSSSRATSQLESKRISASLAAAQGAGGKKPSPPTADEARAKKDDGDSTAPVPRNRTADPPAASRKPPSAAGASDSKKKI
jgi:hypothetical protein